jgi:hypothetical protein
VCVYEKEDNLSEKARSSLSTLAPAADLFNTFF